LRVALFSGGKESFYASVLAGPVDAYVVFIYEFPEPSPHLINLSLSIESGTSTGLPVIVKSLSRGREFIESVEFLKSLGTNVIVAGDVYVEEHLRYMERLASEVGAELKEPLWGLDPEEVLAKEVEYGIEALVTGVRESASELLGKLISRETHEELLDLIRKLGIDPIGERGEYHTLVINSPKHLRRVRYRVLNTFRRGGVEVLILTNY